MDKKEISIKFQEYDPQFMGEFNKELEFYKNNPSNANKARHAILGLFYAKLDESLDK